MYERIDEDLQILKKEYESFSLENSDSKSFRDVKFLPFNDFNMILSYFIENRQKSLQNQGADPPTKRNR